MITFWAKLAVPECTSKSIRSPFPAMNERPGKWSSFCWISIEEISSSLLLYFSSVKELLHPKSIKRKITMKKFGFKIKLVLGFPKVKLTVIPITKSKPKLYQKQTFAIFFTWNASTYQEKRFFSTNCQTVDDFIKEEQIIQLGNEPFRIDLITTVEGVDFEECYSKKVVFHIDGMALKTISKEMLKKNKKASGRHKDLDDYEHL